jgi:ectoine hydroxylase-related dioxygenase (phytanoyl-CoA dioxygenase family)
MNNTPPRDALVHDRINGNNIAFYKKQGYLIAPRLLSTDEVDKIASEALAICSGKRGQVEGLDLSVPKTSNDDVLSKYAAIHFPHKISPVMKAFAGHRSISRILENIISPNVKCMQTMLFMKAPGKKGQSWHQDEFYIPTRDRSLTGVWIAVDDANIANGCLWVVPGSHLDGSIRKRIPYSGDEYADVDMCDISPYSESDFVPVEVPAGSVVFFNGYLFHSSLRNKTTDRYRRALVCHYSSAESMLPWDQDGRIERTDDFRDIFMVTGKDPYAYKGIQDISKPFVRPDVLDFATEAFRERMKAEQRNKGDQKTT